MNILQGFQSILDVFSSKKENSSRTALRKLGEEFKSIQQEKGQRATKVQSNKIKEIRTQIQKLDVKGFAIDRKDEQLFIGKIVSVCITTDGDILYFTSSGPQGFETKEEAISVYTNGIESEIKERTSEIKKMQVKISNYRTTVKELKARYIKATKLIDQTPTL